MEPIIGTPVASFADLLLDAVCVVDACGRFVFVSAACEQIFGYTQQEMIGMAMIDLVAPADRARTLAAAQDVMCGRSHTHFENRYVRKDGSLVHIMWSARWSEADQLRVAVARDVTVLKQAQAGQAALYAISEAAHGADDLDGLFQRSHAIIGDLIPAAGFTVALHGRAGEALQFAYHVDGGTADGALVRRLCEAVLHKAEPVLHACDGSAALAVPLGTPDGMLGVLVLRSGPGGARYTDQDRSLLQFVSTQLAAAIHRQRLQEHLHFMAMHDELTRLPNRRLFHDRLATAFARVQRAQGRLALLLIDVNRFKEVNDRHGHLCGDQLLRQLAGRIGACVRDTDTLARLGGDEFVVLLENQAAPADAALVEEKIHRALDAPFELGDAIRLDVSVSIGAAHFPDHGTSREALVAHADALMYGAKARSRAPLDAEDTRAASYN